METLKPSDLLYGETEGYAPLRNALSAWLLRSRGVIADAKNIFITSGATHAISLAIDSLADKTGVFVIEDPAHFGVVRQLKQRDLPYHGVSVDENGLTTQKIRDNDIAGVYVTPSHQFPLGYVMSAARRVQLVTMARKNRFYIIEDDYDSEYRFDGPPLPPLYSMDPESVIYVGTFSKTLFPALRIGYAVVPEHLQKKWLTARRYTDVQNSIVEQAVLTEFLERRMMDMHIKRTTKFYAGKRELLKKAISEIIGDKAVILGDAAGLHMAVRFAGQKFDATFQSTCRENGIFLGISSAYALKKGKFEDTLLLGYGKIEEDDILPGMRKLAGLLSQR